MTLLKNAETVKVLDQKKLDKYSLNAYVGNCSTHVSSSSHVPSGSAAESMQCPAGGHVIDFAFVVTRVVVFVMIVLENSALLLVRFVLQKGWAPSTHRL